MFHGSVRTCRCVKRLCIVSDYNTSQTLSSTYMADKPHSNCEHPLRDQSSTSSLKLVQDTDKQHDTRRALDTFPLLVPMHSFTLVCTCSSKLAIMAPTSLYCLTVFQQLSTQLPSNGLRCRCVNEERSAVKGWLPRFALLMHMYGTNTPSWTTEYTAILCLVYAANKQVKGL